MARVFVAIDDRRGIAGFYSLSSFTLAIADLPPEHAKRLSRYDAIPAALIGRLARDEKVRGEGVGDLLLADAVRRVIGDRSLAVFAIVVEATDEKAAAFYATLDSRRFRTVRSDCSCLRPKRRRPFPARCCGSCRCRSEAIIASKSENLTARQKVYGWKSLGSNVNGVTALIVIRLLPE